MQSLQDHFLIAMPAMADPNFTETVTYICKHDADGAFGLVINRPSDLSLGEMLGQLAIDIANRSLAERPVMHGGPVEPERGFVLPSGAQPGQRIERGVDDAADPRVAGLAHGAPARS